MTDIARERRLLTAQGLKIRTREQADYTFDYNSDREVTAIAEDFFLHIAVVNDPGDLLGTEDQVARTIERIGRQRFPNTGISYNALAFNTGRLYEGQPLTRRGAHTVNDKKLATCPNHGGSLVVPGKSGDARWNLNYSVRALCLPQMVDDPVTDVQLRAAAKWAAAQIRARLAKTSARWHGHYDVAWKECPGPIAVRLLGRLNAYTRYYTEVGLVPATGGTGMALEFGTPIPGQVDPDGSPVTVGEALIRGGVYSYRVLTDGDGEVGLQTRVQRVESRLNALEA